MYSSETLPLMIVGDINIKLNRKHDSETLRYLELLDPHRFYQHVNKPTHRSGNTLDHIITRKDDSALLGFTVEPCKALSDHFRVFFDMKLSRCNKLAPKMMNVRKLRSIDKAALATDIAEMAACPGKAENATLAYSEIMLTLLDKHALMKTIKLKGQTKKPWYNDTIHASRRTRRRLEKQWLKTGLEVHREMYDEQGKMVVSMIVNAKRMYYHDKLTTCDNRNMFRTVNGLLCTGTDRRLPTCDDELQLANDFAVFLEGKILEIPKGFATPHKDTAEPPEQMLPSFQSVTEEELLKLIRSRLSKSCALDPIPTILPLLMKCVNESIASGVVPDCLKTSLVTPLLKKPSLDRDVLLYYITSTIVL
ncbi:uncharacterized protein LOC135491073 [Lineus longissimus]|uniref:uncharacterized protein LOC135491073 n=1 Tax=Lineus longissimus TaxID=88925 RepID=UPI00315C8AE7